MEIKADCICDALTRFRHSCDLDYGRLFDDARTVELGQTEDWYRTVISARVNMGACALDARSQAEGTAWVDVVDLDALNIKDSRFCVLGMVYGHYDNAPDELRMNSHAEAFGFAWYTGSEWTEHAEAAGMLGGPGITAECELLTHYWTKAITYRRALAKAYAARNAKTECAHVWVAGMCYVDDEDVAAVAATRPVRCEKCDNAY